MIRFSGNLPDGLRFEMSRENVRRHLGMPDRYSETRGDWERPYDAFSRMTSETHITYSDDLGRILLVPIQDKAEQASAPNAKSPGV